MKINKLIFLFSTELILFIYINVYINCLFHQFSSISLSIQMVCMYATLLSKHCFSLYRRTFLQSKFSVATKCRLWNGASWYSGLSGPVWREQVVRFRRVPPTLPTPTDLPPSLQPNPHLARPSSIHSSTHPSVCWWGLVWTQTSDSDARGASSHTGRDDRKEKGKTIRHRQQQTPTF